MRQAIIKFRGFKITKREILADIIFLAVSFIISLSALFIFDIHWSLYPGNSLFPPSKYVGIGSSTYIIGTLVGSILGFFIIKLFLLGIQEDIKKK